MDPEKLRSAAHVTGPNGSLFANLVAACSHRLPGPVQMDHSLQILLLLAITRLRRPKSKEDNDDDENPTVRAVRTRKSIKAAESEEEVVGWRSDAEEGNDSDF